jgi:hypothetical protein
MNQDHRDSVISYIESYNTKPLLFKYQDNKVQELEFKTNGQLVKECLLLSQEYCSYQGLIKETDRCRNRSSLDIWRHCKYFKPDITIFDVMHELYILGEENSVETLFCEEVQRRVFYSDPGYFDGEDDFDDYCNEIYDEYELLFKDWDII